MATKGHTAALPPALWLYLGLAFTALFVALLFFNPQFPAFTPYNIALPYWSPLCGLLPVFFFLYRGFKKMAAVWLLLPLPGILFFNLSLLRPDVYFLLLCLWIAIFCRTREQVSLGLRLVLAGMYIWTGIHKINPDFLKGMAPFLQKHIFHGVVSDDLLHAAVVSFPVSEILLGLLCLLPFVRIRAIAGIMLHIVILGTLIGSGWNLSMLAWNLFLLLCFVFLWNDSARYSGENIRRNAIPALLSLLFPALFLLGYWPVFASWPMYSARVESYYVDIPEKTALDPPPVIKPFVYKLDNTYYVGLTQWADAETGGAPCSEPVFKSLVFEQSREYIQNME